MSDRINAHVKPVVTRIFLLFSSGGFLYLFDVRIDDTEACVALLQGVDIGQPLLGRDTHAAELELFCIHYLLQKCQIMFCFVRILNVVAQLFQELPQSVKCRELFLIICQAVGNG